MLYKYYIYYELGVHHLPIETTKEDFYAVIDHLSTEFQISRVEISFDIVMFEILNYWGVFQLVGFTGLVPQE